MLEKFLIQNIVAFKFKNMKINRFATNLAVIFLSVSGGMFISNRAEAHHIDLGWKSTLQNLGLDKSENIGRKINFECTPAPEYIGRTMAAIGTDNYSNQSKICTSALHSGIISRDGGFITIRIDPGQEFYTSTERNGIESVNGRATDISFSFVSESVKNQSTVAAVNQSSERTELGWKSTLQNLGLDESENIGREFNFECTPAPEHIGRTMAAIGTDNYSNQSKICTSALHAGIISRDGGFVTIQIDPGREFYTSTERNGVESSNGRATDISFSFVGKSVINNETPVQSKPSSNNDEEDRRVIEQEVEEGIKDTLQDLF